jgi:hypothetical protein
MLDKKYTDDKELMKRFKKSAKTIIKNKCCNGIDCLDCPRGYSLKCEDYLKKDCDVVMDDKKTYKTVQNTMKQFLSTYFPKNKKTYKQKYIKIIKNHYSDDMCRTMYGNGQRHGKSVLEWLYACERGCYE